MTTTARNLALLGALTALLLVIILGVLDYANRSTVGTTALLEATEESTAVEEAERPDFRPCPRGPYQPLPGEEDQETGDINEPCPPEESESPESPETPIQPNRAPYFPALNYDAYPFQPVPDSPPEPENYVLYGQKTDNYHLGEVETFVWDFTAYDPDGDTENGGGLAYHLEQGNDDDATFFAVDPDTGLLAFKTTPDRDNTIDSTGDHEYIATAIVTDSSGASGRQKLYVQVLSEDDTGQHSSTAPTPPPGGPTDAPEEGQPLDLIVPDEITVTAGQVAGDTIIAANNLGQPIQLRILGAVAPPDARNFCALEGESEICTTPECRKPALPAGGPPLP
jgi:hypothetical protein